MKLKRIYRRFQDWEEVKFNMWGNVKDKKKWLKKAINFTSQHKLYGSYMQRVIREWPISCENALTDYSMNRKAWIGHAATAMAIQCPEDITRLAWGKLSNEQQFLANKEASRAISMWEDNYRENNGIYRNMGEEMLFGRHSR
jgi:hypothetical protein